MPRPERWSRRSALALTAAALAARRVAAADGDAVVVVSWGGAYAAAQRAAIFDPFTAQTGIEVRLKRYDGTLADLEARAAAEGWDAVDMLEGQAIAGCEAELLSPLAPQQVAVPAPEGGLKDDFIAGAFRPCSVTQNVFATVMAYDTRAFPGIKPARLEDFFDLDRFPGARGVQKSPDVILEWALMAQGVPPAQVYDLLSTDRGLELAFRKLDRIRGAIRWWQDAGASPAMLSEGRAAMASGFNGRFFTAREEDGAPIQVIWDGRVIGQEVWAIPAASPRRALAEKFLRFATAPAQLAALAERIPYGPARASAMARVGLHPGSATPMRDHLPNAPQHGARSLRRDALWYARTQALRRRRFAAWLSGADAEG